MTAIERTRNQVCRQVENAFQRYLLACEAEVFGASQHRDTAKGYWEHVLLFQDVLRKFVTEHEELHNERVTKCLSIKRHVSYENY